MVTPLGALGKRIYEEGIDSKGITYANEGEAGPFCPLIIFIGVKPHSLAYDDAVATAEGLPDIEVAFVELVLTRSAAGTKHLSFGPLLDYISDLRKPFTPTTLGVPIASLKFPYYEGTGGLCLRLARVVMLTCAHVVRPPPVYGNTGTTRKQGQACEEIISLGNLAYSNALMAMMVEIGNQ
jgi:hypothetical protein